MTTKKVVLGACLLVVGNAVAQDKTYTVKEGDTLSEIAGKFGVKTKAILSANQLASADKLKLGLKLRIPKPTGKTSTVTDKSAYGANAYTVREGDNDVVIAKRLGVTPKELRVANLGTKWTSLHPGQVLKVPGGKGWFSNLAHRSGGTTAAPTKVAAKQEAKPAKKATVVAKTYKVQDGDNDWIIAKKLGTKPSILKNLNPDVKWSALQIGTVIRIPGTTTTTVASNSKGAPAKKILRSRYAVITGDGVTLRREPGLHAEVVTRVDRGTQVKVLDRDGSWYKARFPRGTEAWVRGDFLAAAAAPVVASNERSEKKSKKSSKRTVVAKNEAPLRSSSRYSRARRDSRGPARYTRADGKVVNVDADGNPIIERAKGMLGVRYSYGSSSRSATDCSGLTSQVYRAQGISLPRTAREQSGRGQAVSKGSLKPGDLVFFKTNRGTRINHVGIYAGNGKFIHASSGGGRVMVSSLNEGYYQRRFAGARRVASFKSSKSHKEAVKKKEAPREEAVSKAPVDTNPNPPAKTDN